MPSVPHIFGVRHLSPAAAWHLRRLLDRVKPKLVLIEGSDDADELIPHIVSPKSKPPIAFLAYTADAPVRTFAYPLASYSPEYQALLWCREHKAQARFIDLTGWREDYQLTLDETWAQTRRRAGRGRH